jgi:hypothetical protein
MGRALGKEEKAFFLKKEAKTFALWRARWVNAHTLKAKVFWFFFSKKNRLSFPHV